MRSLWIAAPPHAWKPMSIQARGGGALQARGAASDQAERAPHHAPAGDVVSTLLRPGGTESPGCVVVSISTTEESPDMKPADRPDHELPAVGKGWHRSWRVAWWREAWTEPRTSVEYGLYGMALEHAEKVATFPTSNDGGAVVKVVIEERML